MAVISVLMVLLVGTAGALGMWRLFNASESFVDNEYTTRAAMGDFQQSIGNLRRFEKDIVISLDGGKLDAIRNYKKRWDAEVDKARETLAVMQRGQTPSGVQSADKPEDKPIDPAAALQRYVDGLNAVYKQIDSGTITQVKDANHQLDAHKGSIRDLDNWLRKRSELLAESVRSSQAGAMSGMKLTLAQMSALTLLGAFIAIIAAIVVVRSIVRPLAEVTDHASRVAAGDLSVNPEPAFHDEPAALQRKMNEMARSLTDLVRRVSQNSDSITTAATEVAVGNQDLSSRTEQTASNLQETAASMAQLSQTVNQNAEAARTASQLASSASSVARQGGDVVGQVVSTMNDITASSKKITEIIGVIDGIAFQTNILALNASVEAARAGEQGRGFAVVAGEVRNLAQRSAEAAKEIKTLIGSSSERVQTGSQLVEQAGITMNEIVASVQRVTDMIAEITASTTEQASGITQVNQAVGVLDQMTQQNAALVEQSAAAAESLKAQARDLAQAVGAFRFAHV
jgi:methyl-accepting chemotaxis protein